MRISRGMGAIRKSKIPKPAPATSSSKALGVTKGRTARNTRVPEASAKPMEFKRKISVAQTLDGLKK